MLLGVRLLVNPNVRQVLMMNTTELATLDKCVFLSPSSGDDISGERSIFTPLAIHHDSMQADVDLGIPSNLTDSGLFLLNKEVVAKIRIAS